jgi:Holliday junction resolvase RusA-like endonuclease
VTDRPLVEMGGFQSWEPPTADLADRTDVGNLLVLMSGGDAGRIVVIPGEPPSKARPRAQIRKKRSGEAYVHTYTPTETIKNEERLAWQLRPLGSHPAGALALAAIFYRSSARRVDIDNLQKALLDSATRAHVWHDDSQVKAIACLLRVDRVNPRIVCALAAVPTSQLEIPA